MIGSKVLLDTNVAIAIANGKVAQRAFFDRFAEVWIPAIVCGELFYGAEKSSRVHLNIQRYEQLISGLQIAMVDEPIARKYGQIKNSLREQGRPIPINDIWVAATALGAGLPLLTLDKHFDPVEGLILVDTSEAGL